MVLHIRYFIFITNSKLHSLYSFSQRLMLNTLDPKQIICAFNKFNKSWKQFTSKLHLSATLNENFVDNNLQVFNQQNIDDLFNQVNLLQLKDQQIQLNKNNTVDKIYLPFLDFFKDLIYPDFLLSGLPKVFYKNKPSNLQPNHKQKVKKCADLTRKFKQLYIVGKIIGEGAYASVRIGVYKPQQKIVAIKVYEKIKISKIQRKRSFLREIKILSYMNHQNIVKFYNVVQTNNHLNIVMEYLQGISLSQFLKAHENKRLSQRQCRIIIRGLASALHHMKSKNISHRDIKLQNVIIDKNLNPKLIDFGFSTCMQSEQKIQLFCGTPSYMAPQILQRRQCCGMKADIWALGVLFFVILTGVFPFKGSTDQELQKRIIHSQYPKSQISNTKQLYQLIVSMLKTNPDQRITPYQILNHSWITGQSRINIKKSTKVDRLHSYDSKKRSNTTASYHNDRKIDLKSGNKIKLVTQIQKQIQITNEQKLSIKQCLNRTLKTRQPSLQNRKSSKQYHMVKTKKQKKEEGQRRKFWIKKQEIKKLNRSKSKIKLI